MNHRALEANIDYLLKHFSKEQVFEYYPRRIVTPMEYLNPKYFSSLLFKFIYHHIVTENTLTPEAEQEALECQRFAGVLLEKKVPTYFVGGEFLESVEQTDIVESFTFAHLHFPMPGFLLVLPDQFTVSKTVLNVAFVMVSTLNGSLYIRPFGIEKDNADFASVSTNIRFEGVENSVRNYIEEGTERQKSAPLSDAHNFNVYIFGLVLKLLAILSTQPHALVDTSEDPPARSKRERKAGRITDALWNPNFIGKSYTAKREDQGGIGSGKRMHWRRGHLRNQRYGPERSQIKVVWIEPVLIHSELLTETNPPAKTD